MKVLAGIVTYHPEKDRLIENIKAISPQVDLVVIWDNGGLEELDCEEHPIILPNEEQQNLGIATALNRLCEYGTRHGFDWIITLDQDSVAPGTLVSAYQPFTSDASVGMLCPCILDRNYGSMAYDTGAGQETETVDACITSASMLRLSAWKEIGGFWDHLFIDMVDFDLCWSLQEKGYRILRVNSVSLLHEIGRSRKVRFLGKEEVVFNHSPFRCYYMIRNMLIVGKKHNRYRKCLRWAVRRFLLINLHEPQKFRKDRMMLKGFRDGLRFNRHS